MSTSAGEPELVDIALMGLPVAIWARAQEHGDELMREFALIAADRRPRVGHELPAQLLDLVEQLTGDFAGFTSAQEDELAQASKDGRQAIDLRYRLPPSVGPAALHLGEMLDAADDYCRAGDHLLTLATPPEALAFRQWFLGEFGRQSSGGEPTPWPEWLDAHAERAG